jgi:iron complex outermembrane receptor protein
VHAQQEQPEEHERDRVHGTGHEHEVLEEVMVTATPMARDVVEMSQSATVLQGATLDRELANNIGNTLARLPGLANASFGENVGRPVIRGLQGGRVGMLNDNMTSSDASAISQDHAVPTEPFLVDQVEVLRGPTTLLFGSGAIGGVVNMVSHTIPESAPEDGFDGRAMTQVDTASGQKYGATRLDFGSGKIIGHANAFVRRTDDYDIPGDAHLYGDEDEGHDEDEVAGVLENSFLDNEGGALGGSWLGESWRAGASFTVYDSDYGIPGAHGHDHDEGGPEVPGETEEPEEEDVTIGLENQRWDGLLQGERPFAGFAQLKLNLAQTSYTHTEYEGRKAATIFDSDSTDTRLELSHLPFGPWSGAFGVQLTSRDFAAQGEEAFVPPSGTDTRAMFWIESAEYEHWRLDLGVRHEDVDTSSLPGNLRRDFKPLSWSVAAVWHVNESGHLAFTLADAQRAPNDAELYSDGPHVATQSYEVGNPDLDKEANRHWELAYRVHRGPVTGSISVYYDDFDDYLFQADTGVELDGLPLRLWSQQDAEFRGGEVELRWDLGHLRTGHWQLYGFYDRVHAELANGNHVPRLPPDRVGIGMDWDHASWSGNLTWIHAAAHTLTAPMETSTPGYDQLDAELTWLLPAKGPFDFEVYLQGRNLLDEDIRNSTSFLKDQAPQIGRNLVLGARMAF